MSAPLSHRPILQQVQRLLWWVTLPVVLLVAVLSYLAYQQASRAAQDLVTLQAVSVAREAAAFLASTERSLKLMATRPGVVLMDPQRCDPALGDLIALQPSYANIIVIDPRGALICGARMQASGLPPVNVSDGEGFRAAMAGQPFALGPVRRGPIVGRWVLGALVPVRGADGSVSGVLAAVIDLAQWPLQAPSKEPSDDAVVGVLSRAGTVVLRSPDADKWIGRDMRGSSLLADVLRVGEGSFVAKGAQGFDRFWAVRPIAGTPWIAYAGVRADAVRAGPLRAAGVSLAIILIVALAAWWLAIKAARRLTAPIAQLARVAARAAGGDLGVRADLAGPTEIVAVASEFNRMLELRGTMEAALQQSRQDVEITLQSIGDAVIATDVAARITRMNPAAERLTGWPLADALGRPLDEVFRIISSQTRLPADNPVQRVMEHGQVVGLANHIALLARGGHEYQIADSAAPIRDGNGDIVGVVLVFSDVSEQYRAEAALRETSQRFNDLVNSTDGIVWEADATSFTFTSISQNVERLLGYPAADWLQPGFWADHIAPEDRAQAVQFCAASTGRIEDHEFEYRFITATGRVVWLRDIVRVVTEQGQARWLRGLMVDITAQKETAAALQHTQALLANAEKIGRLGGWELDVQTRQTTWTQAVYDIYELEGTARLTVDEGINYYTPESQPIIGQAVQRAIEQGEPFALELEIISAKGNRRSVHAVGKPDRARGKVSGFFQDITERKRAELALQASLRDKEALLKEVHHRVKNNLQVVTSLLRLEAGRSSDAPTKAVLADMQGRIRAMALLHESVYRSGTLAAIDLGAYLKLVATQAFRSLQTSNPAVQPRLRLELDAVQVGLDQATPCGLLLAELVSNALKHAFPAAAGGEVCIELQPVPGGAADLWRLRVSDSGVGLPADFAARQQDSLGLQLATSLAQQLGGSLVVGAQGDERAGGEAGSPSHTLGGAVFAVTFAVMPPAPLVIAG